MGRRRDEPFPVPSGAIAKPACWATSVLVRSRYAGSFGSPRGLPLDLYGRRRGAVDSIPTLVETTPRRVLFVICRSFSPIGLPGVGRERLMKDMDAWGYSFRLGSTRLWFEQDAEDAKEWLAEAWIFLLEATRGSKSKSSVFLEN